MPAAAPTQDQVFPGPLRRSTAVCATIDVIKAWIEASGMNMAQVEAFLILADELHFGRTAERLALSQPRVSRLMAALEREVGGALFERTSRRVRLTPLGIRLRAGWQPGFAQIRAALEDARAAARQPAGVLRIGFTNTTGGDALTSLVRAFQARYPDCRVILRETRIGDAYAALRRDDIDVLVSWLAVDEPDLTAGPAIDHRDRALAVAHGHPLASRGSVSAEDLADHDMVWAPSVPKAFFDTLVPPRTPSGRPTRRTCPTHGLHETFALVASGRVVHPTVTPLPLAPRSDVALVPIRDLPALSCGLIWCTAHENARIRAIAEVAAAHFTCAAPEL
jgi:DNA-binding transcriptional LysR family regulator